MNFDIKSVIRDHITTERSTILREKNNEYIFRVDSAANKYLIKEAVEKVFGVKVDSVRTLISPGKIRRMGRFSGKTSTWKKAIVRLKKGQTITMFENV